MKAKHPARLLFMVAIFLRIGLFTASAEISAGQTSTNSPTAAKSPLIKTPKTVSELLTLPLDEIEKLDVALINLLTAEGLRGSEKLEVQQYLDTLDSWA